MQRRHPPRDDSWQAHQEQADEGREPLGIATGIAIAAGCCGLAWAIIWVALKLLS